METDGSIIVSKTSRNPSLSLARSIHFKSPSSFLKVHFNFTLPSTSRPSSWSVFLRFSHETLYTPFPFPHAFQCPTHLILDFVTRVVFREEYISWRSWLCSLLQFPVTLLLSLRQEYCNIMRITFVIYFYYILNLGVELHENFVMPKHVGAI